MVVLEMFGLTPKEQAIYLAALELGETLQVALAKKAKIKRTTLREILPQLLDRGILQQKVKGKRKYLVASDPKELIKSLEEQTNKAKEALPALLALQNTLAEKPEVRFFEGVEGVKQVYELTLEVRLPIYSFISSEKMHPEIIKWVLDYYQPQKLAKKVWAYNIVAEAPENKMIMPEHGYRENKVVSKEKFPFKMEVMTFGDYVAFIHFRQNEEPSAVLIKSKAAAETVRSIHKLAWGVI